MNAKIFFRLLAISLIFILFFAGTNRNEKNKDTIINSYYNSKTLDNNQINFPLDNTGNIGWTPADIKVTWNNIEGYNMIVYDQGLWMVGKIDDVPHWTYGKWSSVYSPGPIIDGQAAMLINPEDSLRYRVYKISNGDDDSNPDYLEWPVEFGAPVDDQGDPRLYDDQTLWTVYNGLDSTIESWGRRDDTIAVTPVEINQTVFAREGQGSDADDIFSNIIFLEYQVINKGQQIDSAYIGFWTDIDFLNASENPPGIDTVNQLGYCWYSEDSSPAFPGITPPAVGYVQLYGPVIPSNGNTAVFKGKLREDYKNLALSSYKGIEDDASFRPLYGMPSTTNQAWNTARGLDLNGQIIHDPTTGEPTRFPLSGDPVTNTGWIYDTVHGTGGGAGFVMFNGPFTMAPGDTQWVMYALVPGMGSDRFQSIEAMRKKASILHQMPYDSLVAGKRAIGTWYAGEAQVMLDKIAVHAGVDSLILQATFPNPDEHDFTAQAIISSIDNIYTDSLFIYDDGNHHDQEANDGIWGTIIPPIAQENTFNVSLIANDLNSKAYFTSNNLAEFTSIGPVSLDHYTIISPDTIPNPGDLINFELTLKNLGLVTSAINITTVLNPLDTCATLAVSFEDPNYGDIAAGQSVPGSRGHRVNFLEECPDSIWISFEVEIYSVDKHFWTDTFSVFIHGTPSAIPGIKTDIPKTFALRQNYPNPFNPKTIINYELPITNDVELGIYNLLGQKVATLVNERQNAGYHQVEWNASGFSTGIYYYMINSGDFLEIRKMVLLR